MILIIAEKPVVCRAIASAIGNMKLTNGHYQNSQYIIVNAYGHLFTLSDIEDYEENPDYKWKLDNIPCFPRNFKYKLVQNNGNYSKNGVEKQFKLIKDLCNREDVDTIVNAGDSDREGEIIIRLIVQNALEKNKKFLRIWLPDQTDITINEELKNLKDEKEYDNLANEGFARTYIDWLYGVNLTRYATLKTGTLLRVGRVIVPIVKAIYDRDMEIRNFKPDIYYGMISKEITNGEEIELNSKEKFEKSKKNICLQTCEKYNQSKAVVTNKKIKEDILNPGKLYSLSKLQNQLGKRYKMSMEKSLSIVQKLYESGYLTYPRTNSEYLATNEKDKVKTILSTISKIGYPVEFKDKKAIFDDSKIESHSALTPTYKIPKKENLTEEEFKVYQVVFQRFIAVFCKEPCKIQKTEISIKVGDYEEFVLKGNVIQQPGWTKYDKYNAKDKILPNINIGDEINIKFVPKEKETTPPKHYTTAALNNYLINPFRKEKKELDDLPEGEIFTINGEEIDDTEDYKAIFQGLELGTEATRTGIISNAIKSKYIALKNDTYTILPEGEFLINSLTQMGIQMDKYKTSELGQALKKVFRKEMTIEESVNIAKEEIKLVFKKDDQNIEQDTDIGFYGDIIGKCPKCGNDVIRSKYNYCCKNYKECDFRINLNICSRIISKKNAQLILKNGYSSKIQGFTSKSGKKFDSKLKLDDNKAIIFDFSN